jgi:hypothetical protein
MRRMNPRERAELRDQIVRAALERGLSNPLLQSHDQDSLLIIDEVVTRRKTTRQINLRALGNKS